MTARAVSRPSLSRRVVASPAGRAMVAVALVLLLGCIFNADGAFFRLGTHRDVLRQSSVYGILACGMTLVIISGGIDLAVGSILALGAVVVSLLTIHLDVSPWIALPVTALLCATCGAASGCATSLLRIQPFIATLATMVFVRGLAKLLSGGMKVSTSVRQPDGTFAFVDVPEAFRAIDRRVLGGTVSVVTIVFLACVTVTWLLQSRHVWGRWIYAIGGNEEAARLSGVPVRAATVGAYVLCGLLAGVAGICQAAQERQGDPDAGVAYELVAISMVVIGGTSLRGGTGGVGLTLLGVLTIGYAEKILSINAVAEAGRLMLMGAILVVAVLAQRRRASA